MLLPCPHCRRQFRLHREQIRFERVGIKCPACEGVFCIDFTSPTQADKASPAAASLLLTTTTRTPDIEHRDLQAEPAALPDDEQETFLDAKREAVVREPAPPDFRLHGHDIDRHLADRARFQRENESISAAVPPAGPSAGIHPEAVKHVGARRRPGSLAFWTLVPACFVFVVVTGVLLSGPWQKSGVPNDPPVRTEPGSEASYSFSLSSKPGLSTSRRDAGEEATPEHANLSSLTEDQVALAFWAPPNSDAADLCEVLLRPPNAEPSTKDEENCRLYPPWITYLVLDKEQIPACELAPAFVRATRATEQHALCGRGYAFLSSYYLKINVLERAQSFLEEAIRLDPSDPWVRLVDACFCEKAQGENPRTLDILEELHKEYPTFLVAGYLLAKTHIRQEDYRRASEIFESMKEDVKGQVAFWRIRRALSSLENADGYTVQKAEGLLAMSRAFASLKDYPMAEHLYSWILEEMPGKLPKGERVAAYCELGRIYETKGEKSKAYDSYRNAIDIDPEFQAAREGIRNLLSVPANHS